MSGSHIIRPRPNKCIDIILDKIFNKSVPKPTNLRPGYEMEYIKNYYAYLGYSTPFEKALEAEKIFDNLSIISSHETPQQWADRIRPTLRILINEKYSSYYHVFCLFGSFGQGVTETCYNNCTGKEIPISYHRPNVHNSKMAICFDCWKLIKVDDIKPRKEYFGGWRRWGYEIKSEDLMKDHWDNACFKAKTITIAKNIIPNAPKFEPVCIPPARQEMVSPISSRTTLGDLAEAYFDSVRKSA